MSERAYIGLGSNLGDGLQTLQSAWREIGNRSGVRALALSSAYLSAPVGMESDNWFTNAVGALDCQCDASELLDLLLEIESDFGRRRDPLASGYQDRTLDLDLIYHGDHIIESERLRLPHPCHGERLFVLLPLAEIAPDYRDPADGLTVKEKLDGLYRDMASGRVSQQEITRQDWPAA